MKRLSVAIGLIGLLVAVAEAAVRDFEEVPASANKYLKAVKGKPIRTGMVFVNGHYMKPPYTLMRSGTALFVNHGTQITGQVVPWKAFLATQSGVIAAQQAAAQAAAAQPVVAPKRTTPKPTRPAVVQDVDDLFDDTPPAPAPAPTPKPARPAVVQDVDDLFDDKPPAPAPAPSVSASPVAPRSTALSEAEEAADASFKPNEHSQVLLKRINDRRSYFDRKLREGNVIFFGSRYSPVTVEPRLVRSLLAVLPEAMREAEDGAQLYAALRSKGIVYLSREVCDDLVENRQDYRQVIEHRKTITKDDELRKLLESGR